MRTNQLLPLGFPSPVSSGYRANIAYLIRVDIFTAALAAAHLSLMTPPNAVSRRQRGTDNRLSGHHRGALTAEPVPFERCDYQIHPDIFKLTRSFFADTYGSDLVIDVFASSTNRQLPNFGPSLFSDSLDQCRRHGHALYINGDWTTYDKVIPWLVSLKVTSVVVAPRWDEHPWYGLLLNFAKHSWRLPDHVDTFRPISTRYGHGIGRVPWPVSIFFADFRQLRSFYSKTLLYSVSSS